MSPATATGQLLARYKTYGARPLPAVAASNPRGRHRRSDREPAMAAGENGVVQLRRCAGDRDRPAEAVHPGRLMAGAGEPDRPRRVLAAAVAAVWRPGHERGGVGRPGARRTGRFPWGAGPGRP